MKKVLLITPDFHPVIGGAEIFATKLVDYFSIYSSYKLTIITRQPTLYSKKINNIGRTKFYEKNDYLTIIRVPYFEIKNLRVLSSVPFFIIISNIFNILYRYDVIHYIGFFPAAIIHKFLFKFKKQKYIYTEQGMILDVIRDNKNIYDESPFFIKKIYKYFFNKVDTLIAVSVNVKNKLLDHAERKEILIIPNGVDSIHQTKKNSGNNIFNIISSSRLVEKNNIFYLVKEFHHLLMSNNFNISLDIYGDGEERQIIQNYINNHQLNDFIKLHGTVNHDVILQAYREANLFVRPSLTEGFGISFIEALAAGLPVIGSDAVEILGTYNKDCGSSVQYFVPGELSSLIQKYIIDHHFYDNQSMAAIKYSKNFLWSTIFKRYHEIYKY